MKSPDVLQKKLSSQWQRASYRLSRLLNPERDQWPIKLVIGKPTSEQFRQSYSSVKKHIQSWKQVGVGQVHWQDIPYRELSEAVRLPVSWELSKPSDWIKATNRTDIIEEFRFLETVLADAEPIFMEVMIGKPLLWRGKSIEDVKRSLALASKLEPGCAEGRPLRLMSGLEVDTKFFERNETLLVALLDERFDGDVKQQGLSVFLNAQIEGDHWLLVVPLQDGLLPFPRLRLSTKQLVQLELPATTIMVIENERCEHLLPNLEDTIAILGAGLDLNWLSSSIFANKQILYWGDIDTWGFKMLAMARAFRPELQAVLMDRRTFYEYKEKNAVIEPVKATDFALESLTESERQFYCDLCNLDKSRLEQEYLPKEAVESFLSKLNLGSTIN